MMIITSRNIDEMTLIFQEYLAEMRQFYAIADYPSWSAVALKNLKRYKTAPDHHIFMIKDVERVIGFALINQKLRFNDRGFAVAEFFIHGSHRKQGHGRRLADHVFSSFPGLWEIAVSEKNLPARTFWMRVLPAVIRSEWAETIKHPFSGSGFIFNNML